jgi:hypothetical protein
MIYHNCSSFQGIYLQETYYLSKKVIISNIKKKNLFTKEGKLVRESREQRFN